MIVYRSQTLVNTTFKIKQNTKYKEVLQSRRALLIWKLNTGFGYHYNPGIRKSGHLGAEVT